MELILPLALSQLTTGTGCLTGAVIIRYLTRWAMLDSDQDLADILHKRSKELEKHIACQALKHFDKLYTLLLGIKGVGDVIASTLLYEIYDLTRFVSQVRLLHR